jgi:hypothetical protein
MGFFGSLQAEEAHEKLHAVETASTKHPQWSIQATQRLPIKLPEPSEVGSSAGEEWRSLKGAVKTSRAGYGSV